MATTVKKAVEPEQSDTLAGFCTMLTAVGWGRARTVNLGRNKTAEHKEHHRVIFQSIGFFIMYENEVCNRELEILPTQNIIFPADFA